MFINSFKKLIKNIFDYDVSDDQTNTHEIIEKLNNIKIKKKVRFNI